MTSPSYEAQLRRLSRVLSEIAQTLESIEHAHARVERAMTLLKEVVPYRRCAVLEVRDDGAEQLYAVPALPVEDRAGVARRMGRLFELVSRAEHIGRSAEPNPGLSLPLIGLDDTIGVIRVEPDSIGYDAAHLRVLSVVAAQLGAYLATLRLRERDRRREERLAAAHDFQQLLAGIVSHDLRNPLAVITTVATTLLQRTTDERQAESLRRALRNARHAVRLISDLADVTEARVSGSISLAPAPRLLGPVLDQVVEDLRSAHPGSTIELLCDVPGDVEVTWDPERITQVLTNLVNNAIAHGAEDRAVGIAVREDEERIALSVHNHGPRIPSDLLPSIFDPFKHGGRKSRSPRSRGLGLGLFIVDQIVRSHGGTIGVASDDHAGTTFTLRIPRACVHHETVLRAPAAAAAPLVMVVDDDEGVRIGMTGILEKRGFSVACARDGLEAMQLLVEGARPRLILLDLAMPRMSGEELCAKLQADPALAQIPIVVISADTSAALELSHERTRAFISKPVSIDRLLAAIEAIP